MAQRTTYSSFDDWVEAKDDIHHERKQAEAEAAAAEAVAKARKTQLADISFSRWTQIKALHERALMVRLARAHSQHQHCSATRPGLFTRRCQPPLLPPPTQFLGQLGGARSATEEAWREVALALAYVECQLVDHRASLPPESSDAIAGSEASLKRRSLAKAFGAWTRKNYSMDVVIPGDVAAKFRAGTRHMFDALPDGTYAIAGLSFQVVTRPDVPGAVVSRRARGGGWRGAACLPACLSQPGELAPLLACPPPCRPSPSRETTCCGTRHGGPRLSPAPRPCTGHTPPASLPLPTADLRELHAQGVAPGVRGGVPCRRRRGRVARGRPPRAQPARLARPAEDRAARAGGRDRLEARVADDCSGRRAAGAHGGGRRRGRRARREGGRGAARGAGQGESPRLGRTQGGPRRAPPAPPRDRCETRRAAAPAL